jgi:hypothetical protein
MYDVDRSCMPGDLFLQFPPLKFIFVPMQKLFKGMPEIDAAKP